jgi:hypothetical protein
MDRWKIGWGDVIWMYVTQKRDGDETERSIERSAVSCLLDCTIMFSRKAVVYVVI